ncbi:MAG: DUF3037 domain-containing protein [Anaerolineae bacterium]|nr:DUF3037 domain-containing protein [Anaerolineae bacterium]
MPTTSSYDYAIVRVVPYVEREEFINVGVILFCREQNFLAARVELNRDRLAALAPDLDEHKVDEIETLLKLIPGLCAGNQSPVGRLSQTERFHWLVNPRSTSIQISPVHPGVCADPSAMLDHLMETMVLQKNSPRFGKP